MANYYCVTRSNYFRVKDEAQFREVMDRVICDEDCLDIWEDNSGVTKQFGFGGYASILGIVEADGDPDDYDYDTFVEELSKCVADDDAIIILEAGHEKLRYVTGLATVITSKGAKHLDIDCVAMNCARELLNNRGWYTSVNY